MVAFIRLNTLLAALVLFSSCNSGIGKVHTDMVLPVHPFLADSNLTRPTRFYTGVVSNGQDKFNTSFSPDGLTMYYTVTSQKLGITGIVSQEFRGGSFGEPEFLPFVSPDYATADVQVSPDGNRLVFSTHKEYEEKSGGFHFDIWSSEKVMGQWQDPMPLSGRVNSPGNEFYPVLTNDHTLYFNSDRNGNSDIYFSKWKDGEYGEPVPLTSNINSPQSESDAFISPDEQFLIFVRVDAPDGFGNSDLYISFNLGNNRWTTPNNLGPGINSPSIDGSPYVSPDGGFLFFTSGRQSEGIREKAMEGYKVFDSITSGSDNGSLNFYYMKFDAEKYRDL